MSLLGSFLFYGWILVILGLFVALPPRRAVIASAVAGWLVLPPAAISLPGLPDYTKVTVTSAGILLASLIFDSGRFLGFRPRWYDLPMLVYCASPFFTSLSNDLGAYDGLSQCFTQVAIWGIPYLIGRAYFTDADGLRELAVGIVFGGLAYIPLILFELRLSPRLSTDVYGMGRWENEIRFGAYRPKVFMSHGLELSMWMAATSITAYGLWVGGALRDIRGVPAAWIHVILACTTVLCRSYGAVILMIFGYALFFASTRGGGRPWLIWVLLVAPAPLYMASRSLGLWSGATAVDLASTLIGPARAQSLEFRMFNEDILVARALERPSLGWGGWNRAFTFNHKIGRMAVVDGLWVIVIGQAGLIGLGSWASASLLPMILLLRRCPVRRWRDPDVAPAGALAVLQGLTLVDNLSNGMVNPIYTIATGGLIAFSPALLGRRAGEDDAEAGPTPEPVRRDPRAGLASRHARMAEGLAADGRPLEAYRACRLAMGLLRASLAAGCPDSPACRHDLAEQHDQVGRILAGLGRRAEAEAARGRALELWEGLAGEFPEDSEYRRCLAAGHNDLAWMLIDDPGPSAADVSRAIRSAGRAVDLMPGDPTGWNTLGAAHFRAGAWEAAIDALEESARLGPGPNAFDLFYLAMARSKLGDRDRARDCFARALAWADRSAEGHAGLARLNAEAAEVLAAPAPEG